ncbi:MAG: hypothetical protein V1755_02430, partial [Chloroflexota bacterium]
VSVGGNQTMVGVTVAVAVAVGSGEGVGVGAGRKPEQAVSAASRLALSVIKAIKVQKEFGREIMSILVE